MDTISLAQRVKRRERRILSCIPCRKHRLKCDREMPCQACCRFKRKEKCCRYPPPATENGASRTMPDASMSAENERAISELMQPQQRKGAASPLLNPHVPDIHDISKLQSLPIADIVNAKYIRYLSSNEQKAHWTALLGATLPSRATCDVLINFFFENLSWVYRVLHKPSFMLDYESFWSKDIKSINIHWLALLFSIILASGIRITVHGCVEYGFDFTELRKDTRIWYSATRQALTLGDGDSSPSIEALQAMINLQHYLYAIGKNDVIKGLLASVVEAARVLGLDNESTNVDMVQREVHHRVWWEICVSDTYHAVSTQKSVLVQSYLSTVPAPRNCNDTEISGRTIIIHPFDEPTEMSMNIARGSIFKVFNRLLKDQGAHLNSFEFVISVDSELCDTIERFPWFFKSEFAHRWAELPPNFHFIPWAYQLLNGCICMQRIRMYWPFIVTKADTAWEVIMEAAFDALTVYQMIRSLQHQPIKDLQNCGIIYYQLFSVAVTLASLLLVHRPKFNDQVKVIRSRIETVALDLDQLSKEEGSSLASEQSKIIGDILEMYDFPSRFDPQSSSLLMSKLYMTLGGRLKSLGENQARSVPRLPSIHIGALAGNSDADLTSESSEKLWTEGLSQDIVASIDLVCLGLEHNSLNNYVDTGYFDLSGT